MHPLLGASKADLYSPDSFTRPCRTGRGDSRSYTRLLLLLELLDVGPLIDAWPARSCHKCAGEWACCRVVHRMLFAALRYAGPYAHCRASACWTAGSGASRVVRADSPGKLYLVRSLSITDVRDDDSEDSRSNVFDLFVSEACLVYVCGTPMEDSFASSCR
jgi:hypothetical protein